MQRSISEERQPRTSRIAVRLRTPSLDRLQYNNVLQPPLSSVRGGGGTGTSNTRISPLNTPSYLKSVPKRSLFTPAPKNNLHNDKKWIAEQSQRIVDYLLSVDNQNFDFTARGLRQISMKQFVSIINFLLSHIWGDRYSVGSNHVDDIINILQKLHYPYAINKSWLKTPTAAHSFGNVILLLDFLMDFVPPPEKSEQLLFELQNTDELSQMHLHYENNEDFYIPDLEFQEKLLSTCADAFPLWNKQMPEYDTLKQQMCDHLIQKVCGIENSNSLYIKLSCMKKALEELLGEHLSDDYVKQLKDRKDLLENEWHGIQESCKTLSNDLNKYDDACQKLLADKMSSLLKIKELEEHNKNLEQTIKNQLCSVKQRNQLISDVDQLKYFLGIKKRTACELESRSNKQRIMESRMIKQNGDDVESFNMHVRQFVYSGLSHIKVDIATKLQLPVNCNRHHLEELYPLLDELKQQALKVIHKNDIETQSLEQDTSNILYELKSKLHIEVNSLCESKRNDERQLQQLDDEMISMISELYNKHEKLVAEALTVQNEIVNLEKQNNQLIDEAEKMKIKNEKIMSKAENDHKISIEKRKKYLKEYDAALTECMNVDVKQLEELVSQLGDRLDKLNKRLDKQIRDFPLD